jgi:ribosomal protein S18 acetylase RimI-like enzyme
MADLTYREGFAPAEFLALAQRVWPREYSLRDTAEALARTTNLGAWDGDRLVGSIRILTDGYFFATIPEILVDPAYQRRGIGRHGSRPRARATRKGRLWGPAAKCRLL